MQLSVMLEPQEGLSYDQILAVAKRAEAVGMHGMYRSDHYSSFGDQAGAAAAEPTPAEPASSAPEPAATQPISPPPSPSPSAVSRWQTS